MALTDKQRKERQRYIGSSDVPAIMDLYRKPEMPSFDPHKNAYDVWLEKTGKLDGKEKTSKAIQRGNYLELALLHFAQDVLGKIRRGGVRTVKALPILKSHLDASLVFSGEPIEAKSRDETYCKPEYREDWGEENTDHVPPRVSIQSTVHCMATEKDRCYVPTIIAGRELVMFQVILDKGFAQTILDCVGEFWDKYVKTDTPPAQLTPSLEVLRHVLRRPDTVAPVDDNLVMEWDNLRQTRLQLEKDEKQAEAVMITATGDAEAGQLSDGRLVTYYQQSREIVDGKRLKEELPDVAAKYMKETVYRVPRLQKRKELTNGK